MSFDILLLRVLPDERVEFPRRRVHIIGARRGMERREANLQFIGVSGGDARF